MTERVNKKKKTTELPVLEDSKLKELEDELNQLNKEIELNKKKKLELKRLKEAEKKNKKLAKEKLKASRGTKAALEELKKKRRERSKLYYNQKIQDGNKYECDTCNYSTSFEKSLESHKKSIKHKYYTLLSNIQSDEVDKYIQ